MIAKYLFIYDPLKLLEVSLKLEPTLLIITGQTLRTKDTNVTTEKAVNSVWIFLSQAILLIFLSYFCFTLSSKVPQYRHYSILLSYTYTRMPL